MNNERIFINDEKLLKTKLELFKEAYKLKKDKVIFITDFDYTMTERYNYENGLTFSSSYELYNQDIIGGDQKKLEEERKILQDEYSKYEDDTTVDENTRKKKLFEWNDIVTDKYIHENFTRDSVKKMVESKKDELSFRKDIKEFYELLIKLNIPIIIVSGGIKEFIEDSIKLIGINGLDNYIANKRMHIIANEYYFDEKTGKCIGKKKDIVYPYNKSDHIVNIIQNNFPNFENAFVLGDYIDDYFAIKKLNLNKDKNIIGFGFINFKPNEYKSNELKSTEIAKQYSKYYDIILFNQEGYKYPLNLMNSYFQ